MSTNTTLIGGCYCGAIRYEINAPHGEIGMFKCHCRDCQRLSGGPYCAVVFVPAGCLTITRGTLHRHETEGQNGPHIRGFCDKCGSRVSGGEGEGSPGIGVTASSLDDPSVFRPQFENFTADVQPWDMLDPNIPHFDKNTPG